MKYRYKAKKGPGDILEGTLDAHNESEVVEKISQMGYFPILVEEDNLTSIGAAATGSIRRKVRSSEVTVFTRQLASLLKSGVPILQSLTIILEQTDNPQFREALRQIHASIKDGAFFSSSLAQYPHLFPALYVALVRAGEGSGALPEALLHVAEYRAKQEELLAHFRASLAYPLLMGVVGLATIVFMLTFVIPRLTGILTSIGQELPAPTKALIATSEALSQWWVWVGALLVVLVLKKQSQAQSAQLPLSALKLRLPLFGKLVLKNELARFSKTLELLIDNGIPILKGLEIAIPVLENEVVKRHLKSSYEALEQGGSFGRSMKDAGIFPPFMTNLIIVGEESGRLTDALREVAATYERDTDQALRAFTSILEPLLILVMGLIVGFIVVAMLLPIFEINVMVR